MGLHYFRTLIAVGDDSPVSRSVVPAERGGEEDYRPSPVPDARRPSVRLHQPDVLFNVWPRRQDLTIS